MPRPPGLLIAIALAVALPVATRAQANGSLMLGGGTVRFAGGPSLAIVSLGPALQVVAPSRGLWLGGAIAALAGGDWYLQGHAALWAATAPLANRWRLATDLQVTGGTRGTATGTGAGQLVAEALWAAPRWGLAVGAGPSYGWIAGAAPVTALHGRLRGWWQRSTWLTPSASVEPTRLLGAWFTDLGAGLVARRGPLETRMWVSGRVSAVYGSKAAAQASLNLRLTPRVSFEASGGSLLPDPYQGFPRSGFVTAGVRLHVPARASPASPFARVTTFTIIRRGDGVLVRLWRHRAHSVSIAGDWNDWTRAPLTPAGQDAWEVVLPLRPGTYHFTLIIDGSPWTIPDGVPSLPDGLGGRVAVLTIL